MIWWLDDPKQRMSAFAYWLPNSLATNRKPDFKMHRLDATGTVSKYLIFRDLTSSSSCSMVTLYKSPSSLWRRKKNAPYRFS